MTSPCSSHPLRPRALGAIGSWLVARSKPLRLATLAACAAGSLSAVDGKVDFAREVRPILSENCFTCHGPDEEQRKKTKTALRLDTRDGLYAHLDDIVPVVAGDPAHSEVIKRITTADADDHMPPAKTGKKLSEAQIAVIRRWIEQGAHWEQHWAFVAPQQAPPPAVAETAWARNPIDRFVLARLEAEHLHHAPEAGKATLIRRLSLDLIGLPPSVAEVDAFVADQRPDAYERAVDRLLATPQYGERMAMAWMDGARYADSNGYQADHERSMWRWRDWLIDAFNRNLPFDRFTIEQLAGDLLPDANTEQRIATGFCRNHRINTEGGIIPEEWHVETVIDRVDTAGQVWLGLTLGCARCHDHKYDPISQKDFYRLFAFFNNVPEPGIGEEKIAGTPPYIQAPTEAQRQKLAAFEAAVDAAKRHVAALSPWSPLEVSEATASGGTHLAKQPDGSLLASKAAERETYSIRAKTSLHRLGAVRLDALADAGLPAKGPGTAENGNFVLSGLNVSVITAAGERVVPLGSAAADFSQDGFPAAQLADGKAEKSGWAVMPHVGVTHQLTVSFAPIDLPSDAVVMLKLVFASPYAKHLIGHLRLSASEQNAALPNAEQAKAETELAAAEKELAEFDKSVPTVMVMSEMPKPRPAFVLLRGLYDKHGEEVEAGTPSSFPPMPKDAPANRLGLARWIVDPANPLTARVAVNRFWERLFGTGLVKTSENLGSQGDLPSHPELLDWLACEFVRLHWDMKAMLKTMVMSAAYRQDSATDAATAARDPENRLLSHGPRFRLQAEIIRDQALAIAGLLSERVGGPSVRPYQPPGIWDELSNYGNLHNYKHDQGADLYRRSLYTIWKRTTPPPDMTLFDMPSREYCLVRRSRTDTPLQALTLMNDETFVEAARMLAGAMIASGGDAVEQRLAYGFRRAVARAPTPAEMEILRRGFDRRLARFRADPEAAKHFIAEGDTKADPTQDPIELAAYATVASTILNLDETVSKE